MGAIATWQSASLGSRDEPRFASSCANTSRKRPCCERLACIRAPEVPAIPASLPPGEAAVAGLVGASAADVEKRAQSTNSHVACGRELGVDREQLEVESARAQVRSVVAIVERKPGTIGVRGEALAESHSQASRLE